MVSAGRLCRLADDTLRLGYLDHARSGSAIHLPPALSNGCNCADLELALSVYVEGGLTTRAWPSAATRTRPVRRRRAVSYVRGELLVACRRRKRGDWAGHRAGLDRAAGHTARVGASGAPTMLVPVERAWR
jgi:hypothetical protein